MPTCSMIRPKQLSSQSVMNAPVLCIPHFVPCHSVFTRHVTVTSSLHERASQCFASTTKIQKYTTCVTKSLIAAKR